MRRRTRGEVGVTDADDDVFGMQSEHLGDHLGEHGSNARPDILHAGQHLNRTIAQHANFAGGINLYVGRPDRLRHANTAFDGTGIGPGDMPVLPTDLFGTDAALFASSRTWVDAVSQRHGIESQALRQLVDCLFHAEGSWGITRTPHR